MRRRLLISPLIALLALSGCARSSSGEFDVSDVRKYGDCLDAVFPFEPLFFTARTRQESTGLFMQSRGGNFQSVDTIYLEVFSQSIAAGTTLTFSRPGEGLDAQMTGEFEMGESCPDLRESLFLDGQVRFDEFDTEQDGFVEGELVGASIISGRDEEIVAGSLTGEFRIEVRDGQPYEEFYVTQ